MLEYHIFTDMNENYQQAHVFVVDRDEEHVSVMDMYSIMIQHRAGEVKTRLNMGELQRLIISTPGGNIHSEDSKTIFEIFGDLIPMEIRLQQKEEDIEKELFELQTDMLIRAAEAAESAHHAPIDENGTIIFTNNTSKS